VVTKVAISGYYSVLEILE